MADDEPLTLDRDTLDPEGVRDRFLALHGRRRAQILEALGERQQDFIHLLPLLFDVNHPSLPGYASNRVPAGVAGYQADQAAQEAARRQARSFQYRRPVGAPAIQAIFLMGSAGTIAFTQNSDFDIWLCHDPELDEEELKELRAKADGVEAWGDSLGLEVHIFFVNPEAFRAGTVEQLSKESAGTAQHLLLLEEFYRTGLWLAGRYPVWWLVPAEREPEYPAVVDAILRRRFVDPESVIDFGGLERIPAEEFFGAGVWQLTKGLGSPFKSALKLLLTENYAADYPDVRLLAVEYKGRIQAGEDDVLALDPYLVLYRRVEAYLHAAGAESRLEMARQALYFKLDEPLSARPGAAHERQPWRREALHALTREWGWDATHLKTLDAWSNWGIEEVAEQRRGVVEMLTRSYQVLSGFAREHGADARISKRDLHILGRRLFTAFERKAGKVEQLGQFAGDVHETRATLHQVTDRDGNERWLLFRGSVPPDQLRGASPLKRGRSLAELLAWGHFNGVLDPSATHLILYRGGYQWRAEETSRALRRLAADFPAPPPEGNVDELARPAGVRTALLLVNVGADPERINTAVRGQGGGDPLEYGGTHANLATAVDLVLVNTWGEAFCHPFRGPAAVARALAELARHGGTAPETLGAEAFESDQAVAIGQRLGELLAAVRPLFLEREGAGRLVFRAGGRFHLVERGGDGGEVREEATTERATLIKYLGRARSTFSPLHVDPKALPRSPLAALARENRPGVVQVFYRARGERADLWVLDERGSLFQQTLAFHTAEALISHLGRFLQSVSRRLTQLRGTADPADGEWTAAFYRVAAGEDGAVKLVSREAVGDGARSYLDLQAIVEQVEGGKTVFSVYCNDQELSSRDHGRNLFAAVADCVRQLRRSGGDYPVYLTDLDLAPAIVGEPPERLQTVHYLFYKQRLESLLNQALEGREAS